MSIEVFLCMVNPESGLVLRGWHAKEWKFEDRDEANKAFDTLQEKLEDE